MKISDVAPTGASWRKI